MEDGVSENERLGIKRKPMENGLQKVGAKIVANVPGRSR